MIVFKLCPVITPAELEMFVPIPVTLTLIQGHRRIRNVKLEFFGGGAERVLHIMLFVTAVCIEGRYDVVPAPAKENSAKVTYLVSKILDSSCLMFPGHVTFGELVSTL